MSDSLANLPGFLQPAAPAVTVPGRELPKAASTALIVATFVLCTIHITPFADLQSVKNIEVWDGGSLYTQAAYSLLFLAALAAMAVIGFHRLRPLAHPVNLILAGWILVSIVFSQAPVASARRLALTFICIFLGAILILVARSVRHFARTLALTAFWILVLSYLSLLFAPNYAMHTTLDLREPDLAGDWRGPFNHKNEAGGVMAMFIFVGLLAYGTGTRLLGAVVVVASAVFLFFTHSKTATALVPLVVLQVALARSITATLPRVIVLLSPALLLALVSLGSFFFKPVQQILSTYMSDTTFTGRTEIWEFALDNILRHPLTGWGYGGFWRTEGTQYGTAGVQQWLTQVDQAHNSYLDTALFMGFPGLVLTLLAFVVMPIRDLQNGVGGRRMDAATMYFVSVWVYVLCSCFFETLLFEGNGALFILFMTSVFALRYRTMLPTAMR